MLQDVLPGAYDLHCSFVHRGAISERIAVELRRPGDREPVYLSASLGPWPGTSAPTAGGRRDPVDAEYTFRSVVVPERGPLELRFHNTDCSTVKARFDFVSFRLQKVDASAFR